MAGPPKRNKEGGALAPPRPDQDWLSPWQAAYQSGVHRSTIDRMIASGDLIAVKFRGSWRISRQELRRWREQQEKKRRAQLKKG